MLLVFVEEGETATFVKPWVLHMHAGLGKNFCTCTIRWMIVMEDCGVQRHFSKNVYTMVTLHHHLDHTEQSMLEDRDSKEFECLQHAVLIMYVWLHYKNTIQLSEKDYTVIPRKQTYR